MNIYIHTCIEIICIWSLYGALLTIERSDIPGNVVAPANSLNPVYSSSIDPHQVSWPLDEAVHRDVGFVEVLQHWPPGACQVVNSMPENTTKMLLEL